jgi:hypothetical protein
MQRAWWCVALVAAIGTATVFTWRSQGTAQPRDPGDQGPAKPAAQVLPLAQVVLFSSGVGYFQREGTIDGNARVDLTFPIGEVNDLLKSLVLLDMDPNKATTVGYDSQEPVERTLMSFALDLTGNPTLGQLLNQARGEKVEVALQQTATGQPAVLSGVIMGMEAQKLPHGKDAVMDSDVLNLLCSEGLRAVPLNQVQRLRFLNAQLDSEFRRALEVLANAHNSQKRNISLTLSGEGKRPIRLGYVVENPIWKTSYRLIQDRDGKLRLQGWALIENTSEEDWRDVKLTLVSSRPISYQMDLYQPLYVPRPTVEPERFASLRPPVFGGAIVDAQNQPNQSVQNPNNFLQQPGQGNSVRNMAQFGQIGQMGQLGAMGGNMGFQGLQGWGNNGSFNFNNDNNRFQNGINPMMFQNARLSFEEMQNRRQQQEQARDQAKKIGSAVALDPVTGLPVVVEGDKVGDYFRYDITQAVTLPRLKSAMLPIVNQVIDGDRVSIFNERVHRTAPLLGLRVKNNTSQHLMQGPVTVFDHGAYAGDARLPDVQPNESRLVAYGIDQGVEVVKVAPTNQERLIKATITKGVLFATAKHKETTLYKVKNRTPGARKVIVEHPLRNGWEITSTTKPSEQTRDLNRFEVNVASEKLENLEVTEERDIGTSITLINSTESALRVFIRSAVTSDKVKKALTQVLEQRKEMADLQVEIAALEKRLKAITDDQMRLRANIDKVPQGTAAYKRYVDKFDTQESQIEKLQSEIETKRVTIEERSKSMAKGLEELNVE